MPLRFEAPADPLTPSATLSPIIESDALHRLTKEIERYGRRELAGRSILIAGHRGVGKTTLVRKAIEYGRGPRTGFRVRPLFVDLHGPDLLAPPEKGESKGPADGTESTALQNFIERLTFSLYRAAAKEFVESYRAATARSPVDLSRVQEYEELCEQFAVELDGSTDLQRLRLLYERVDAMAQGVLSTMPGVSGSQELGLLAASSQAYRMVSGKLGEEQKKETEGSNVSNWTLAADNILAPVAGLLTGSLVWTAMPDGMVPLGKLLGALTAGLASMLALKYTRTVERGTKQSTQVTFVPERNPMALRRLLPVLVDRFCAVGLPPIFVVDELDKVENISERMQELMGFLKQFVTERAFFCFLVDREYYERLEGKISASPFPKEATLFGDRLFVQYRPALQHDYLRAVIKVGTLGVGESEADATRDLEVLPYVLLRRSYMHPFELRREISRSTNSKNEFRFPARELYNGQQFKNEVYYQVAVECVLLEEKFGDFADDPNRAQWIYDALYFPIRTKKPPEEFDASKKAMQDHLAGRMGADNGKLLTAEDQDLLHSSLMELVGFLCRPQELAAKVKKHMTADPKTFPVAAAAVVDAAAAAEVNVTKAAAASAGTGTATPAGTLPSKPMPLLVEGKDPGQYVWQYDKLGYPTALDVSTGAEVTAMRLALRDSAADDALLKDFTAADAALRPFYADMETIERLRLIPTPPTWSYLREAQHALQNPSGLAPTKAAEYRAAFPQYRANLRASLEAIWSALAVVNAMSDYDHQANPESRKQVWLEVLGDVLADAPSRDQMLSQLAAIANDALSTYPDQTKNLPDTASYDSMVTKFVTLAGGRATTRKQDDATVAQQVGAFYSQWFIQFYAGRRPAINQLAPLLGRVIGSRPFGLVKVNPLRMTLADWDRAAESAGAGWDTVVTLERLGFRREAGRRLESMAQDELTSAISQSIRRRGVERFSVVIQRANVSITELWPPSENYACRIRGRYTELGGAKYVLIELDGDSQPGDLNVPNPNPTTRIAFFSATPNVAIPESYRHVPFVAAPQSLDGLVESLEAMPDEAWRPRPTLK